MSDAERQVRFWNRFARRYAKSPVTDQAAYERTLAATRRWLVPEARVFEFGCGTGTTAIRLAPHAGSILAADTAPAIIEIASERAREAGVENVSFLVGGPDAFDRANPPGIVLAFNVIHLVIGWREALLELGRDLPPGTLFISKTACLTGERALIRLGIPLAVKLRIAPPVNIFSEADLVAEIEKAGFEILEREHHGTTGRDVRPFIVARKRG
ncbi:class I SAM-dependent methyltransferase [Arsenicitalea aurantiaca]|nr:class I SAM-dependent methyltransferase [Arsenicitalea aurantiaca]